MPFFKMPSSVFSMVSKRLSSLLALLFASLRPSAPPAPKSVATRGRMFGYARGASGEQSQLDRQIYDLKQYAAANGEQLAGSFSDRSVSGLRADGPEFAALQAEVRAGDVVVVTDLDRISRSLTVVLDVFSAWKDAGVSLAVTSVGKVDLQFVALGAFMREAAAADARTRALQRMAAGRREARRLRDEFARLTGRPATPPAAPKTRRRKRA